VPTVHKRASAKRDLVEHYVYLAEHAGVETVSGFENFLIFYLPRPWNSMSID
jgi:hypothetical protein